MTSLVMDNPRASRHDCEASFGGAPSPSSLLPIILKNRNSMLKSVCVPMLERQPMLIISAGFANMQAALGRWRTAKHGNVKILT
jgi:hypothetical protein